MAKQSMKFLSSMIAPDLPTLEHCMSLSFALQDPPTHTAFKTIEPSTFGFETNFHSPCGNLTPTRCLRPEQYEVGTKYRYVWPSNELNLANASREHKETLRSADLKCASDVNHSWPIATNHCTSCCTGLNLVLSVAIESKS